MKNMNKKILLIRPAPEKEQFGDESFLPLGLGYIAAILRKNNFDVKVFDLLIDKKSDDEVLNFIKYFLPSIIGFSAVTPVVNSAYRLAEKIKKTFPDIFLIIGGPHASALPEEPLNNFFDFVIIGEGENTIIDLLNNLNNPEKVKGIAYKQNGNMQITEPREFITALDDLPFPARDLFPELKLYRGQEALGSRVPVGSILTSRGCPFSCTFCFKAIFGNKFRARSPENILLEWIHLIKDYKVKEIAIVDDSFTTDVNRVIKFCDLLIKEKLKVRWSCPNGIRIDIGDIDMLKKMKEAGCYRVALGIESGNQEVLDKIGKRIKIEQIIKMVENCKRVGIKTMGFYMLGNPGEDEKTMQQTIDFAKKLRTDYAQFLLPIPYPRTKMYEEIKKNGKIFITDWSQYGQYEGSACFSYKNITPELLKAMLKKVNKEYYFNFRYLIKQLFNIETYLFLPRRIKAALRILIGFLK
jgi:radical SAM superfamily enzyme YgiQ (UPF0313 family)